MRWASPPERACAPRSCGKVAQSHIAHELQAPANFLEGFFGNESADGIKVECGKKSRASSMAILVKAGILRSSIRTARDSGRRRPPVHSAQVCVPINCSNSPDAIAAAAKALFEHGDNAFIRIFV